MHSNPDRISRGTAYTSWTRWRDSGRADSKSKNSARTVARFYRATRSFAAGWNDAGRRIVDLRKALETAARPANDTYVASSAN